MDNSHRNPIRCLGGRWEFLQSNQWYKTDSYDQAVLLAWSEPLCYAVVSKQLHGLPLAAYLDRAALCWLEHYQGEPSRLSRLCSELAQTLREKAAEETIAFKWLN